MLCVKDYDFGNPNRAKDVPHLAKLQEQAEGKSGVAINLDNDVLLASRAKASARGIGYETLINQALRSVVGLPADR
ncbi:MAG: BrnA antitoxin family protein [Gammaproteobacteria bacterium]|nr:BrnA antitoxin family protein [Gammaproteobacteria bacterium]